MGIAAPDFEVDEPGFDREDAEARFPDPVLLVSFQVLFNEMFQFPLTVHDLSCAQDPPKGFDDPIVGRNPVRRHPAAATSRPLLRLPGWRGVRETDPPNSRWNKSTDSGMAVAQPTVQIANAGGAEPVGRTGTSR